MALFSDSKFDQLMDQYFDSDCDPQFLYQGSQEDITEVLKAWVTRRKLVYKEQMELRDQAQKSSKLFLSSPNEARNPRNISATISRAARIQELDSQANEDCARATYLLHTLKSRGVTWPELWWQPDIDGGVCSFLGIVDKDFDAHATLTILESKEEEERLQRTAAELQTQFKAHKGHRSATAFEAGSSSNNAGEEQSSAGRGGEPGSSSNNHPGGKASPIRKPDVVTRAEENLKGLVAAMLTSGISDDGPAEGSEKKKSRQEKRAEARAEAKDKAKESK